MIGILAYMDYVKKTRPIRAKMISNVGPRLVPIPPGIHSRRVEFGTVTVKIDDYSYQQASDLITKELVVLVPYKGYGKCAQYNPLSEQFEMEIVLTEPISQVETTIRYDKPVSSSSNKT